MSQITLLPTPVPQASDPTNFDTRADQFLTALPTFASEANTLATEMNSMSQVFTGLSATYPSSGATIAYTPTSGSLSLTISLGRSFLPGMPYTMYASGSPSTHYMTGVISSYNSGTGAAVFTRVTSAGGNRTDTWIVATQGTFPIITTVGSTMFMSDNFGIF